jgi:hypothetical protein
MIVGRHTTGRNSPAEPSRVRGDQLEYRDLEMPQYCTILSPTDEPAQVVSVVRELIGSRGLITIDGAVESWSSMTVQHGDVSLILNRLVFSTPGDEFSKMQRGMWVYFDGIETAHTSIKPDLLERIENFALAIGVVAEPRFVEDSGHFDCIFGLADALDAVIWNGSGILDAEGRMILDGEGNSEVAA